MNGHPGSLSYLGWSENSTLITVLLEKSVTVTGVLLAAVGIALTHASGIVLWDTGFLVVITVMLGVTVVFLGMIKTRFLCDVRDQGTDKTFRLVVDPHKQIGRYHSLRSIIIEIYNTVLVVEMKLEE